MSVKVISRNVGLALLVSALFMFLSALVAVLNGMDSGFTPLVVSGIITLLVGAFPFIFVRDTPEISIKEGFLIVFLSWMLSFIFGMLPYIMWGGEFTVMNAWFESVSGFTTTGSTILKDIEALPDSLLFWRSSTHFIGGMGVVIFLLLIVPDSSAFRLRLTNIEISSLSRQGYRFKASRKVWVIMGVYFGLLVTEFVSLCLAGMPVFDSINHAFSNVATGGFSIKNESIGYYHSNLINFIVMFFMVVSALHFGTIYYAVVDGNFKMLFNPVARYFIRCIIALSLIMAFSLKFSGGYLTWGKALMDGFFHVISYITTTGFAITDTSNIPVLACAVLMFAGFQCACAGSTTGGLKADRMLIAFKAIGRQARQSLRPSMVSRVRVGDINIQDEDVMNVLSFIVVYVVIILVSILLLLMIGVQPVEAFSGSLASVGNVGPGLSTIGTAGNYSAQPFFAKFIYTVDMILGRLEIFPVFIIVSMIFNRQK